MPGNKNNYTWSLYKPSDRKRFLLKVVFEDGEVSRRSTGEKKESAAKRRVPELLEKILSQRKNVTAWQKFVKERSDLMRRRKRKNKYIRDWETVAFRFEAAVDPNGPEDITQENIEKFIDYLREMHIEHNERELKARAIAIAERAEALKTRKRVKKRKDKKLKNMISDVRINGHIALLAAATTTAVKFKMIDSKPVVDPLEIPLEEVAHGRALTASEIDEYFSCVPEVVGEKQKDQWFFFIYGLWYSGFRISEAWQLSWDDRTKISIDNIDGEKPMYVFPLRSQKSKKRQLVPLIPEMIDLLRMVPLRFRKGPVFRPPSTTGEPMVNLINIGKKLSAAGRLANIVVEIDSQSGDPIYASAHDFRRTFADLIMERFKDLTYCQKLMRHASIETTIKYYAIKDVEEFASVVQNRTKESDLKFLGHTAGSHENLEMTDNLRLPSYPTRIRT